MDVFEAVRDSITARQVAEGYGIKVNHSGMAVCPFHNDRNPSMKLDERFHCFGCGADGDAIDFVSRYFDLDALESAMKIADDFGIYYDGWSDSPQMKSPGISVRQKYDEAEQYCYSVLCSYLHLLEEWKTDYAPKTSEENWHPLFIESLQRISYVSYILDEVFLNGGIEDKLKFIKEKGRSMIRLERRINEYTRKEV